MPGSTSRVMGMMRRTGNDRARSNRRLRSAAMSASSSERTVSATAEPDLCARANWAIRPRISPSHSSTAAVRPVDRRQPSSHGQLAVPREHRRGLLQRGQSRPPATEFDEQHQEHRSDRRSRPLPFLGSSHKPTRARMTIGEPRATHDQAERAQDQRSQRALLQYRPGDPDPEDDQGQPDRPPRFAALRSTGSHRCAR